MEWSGIMAAIGCRNFGLQKEEKKLNELMIRFKEIALKWKSNNDYSLKGIVEYFAIIMNGIKIDS
jgi:hypothetical protein